METEYIEKQEAIKAICDSCGVMPDGEKDTCPYKYEGAGCREYDKIIDISPADVRPVIRGRWIKLYENPLDGNFYCSNCKETIDIADGSDTPLKIGLNFCNNCGADMKENKNEKG